MLKKIKFGLKVLGCCTLFSVSSSTLAEEDLSTARANAKLTVASEVLGSAYSSIADHTLGGKRCLNAGTPSYVAENIGFASALEKADSSNLKSIFGIDFSASTLPLFAIFIKLPFTYLPIVYSTETETLSETYVYRADNIFGHSSYTVPDKKGVDILNSTAQPFWGQYIKDPAPFLKACGDSYVSSLTYGASLYVVVQLNFTSHEEKINFNIIKAKFIPGNLMKFIASLHASREVKNMQGKLTVTAMQEGGKPEDLETLLANIKGVRNVSSSVLTKPTSNDLQAKILYQGMPTLYSNDCSLENVDACQSMIQRISNYISQDFPAQFKANNNSEGGPPPNAAVIKVENLSYSGLLLDFVALSPVAPDIIATRQQLSARLKATTEFIANADSISAALADTAFTYKPFLTLLEQARSRHVNNLELIQATGVGCFDSPETCVAAAASLVPEESNDVILPSRLLLTEGQSKTVTLFVDSIADALLPNSKKLFGESSNSAEKYEIEAYFADNDTTLYMTEWQVEPSSGGIGRRLADYSGKLATTGQYSGTVTYHPTEVRNTWTAHLMPSSHN